MIEELKSLLESWRYNEQISEHEFQYAYKMLDDLERQLKARSRQ